ncbi:hypothetical protein CLU79DRAFT_238335, partial [Phycomyces nitens]
MILLCHRYSYSLITIGLVYYFYAIKLVSASYIGPSKGVDYIQPCYVPATFTYNNKLYTFGGKTITAEISNMFSSISLSKEEDSKGQMIYEILPQSYPGPMSSYSQAAILQDNHTALLFTGNVDFWLDSFNTMNTYTYDFRDPNPSWKELFATTNTATPRLRTDFTATMAPNGKFYIYGGADGWTGFILNELWSFDPIKLEYANLTQNNITYRRSHTATVLPNGQIVYISGRLEKEEYGFQFLKSLNEIEIYDTNTNEWIYINATGGSIEGRMDASATLGPDNKTIFFFGGSYLDDIYFNDIKLLDTTTWVWSTPNIAGVYPDARSALSMGFIETNLLAIIYGGGKLVLYTDINILRIDDQENSKYSWLSGPDDILNLKQTGDSPKKMEKEKVAGITIGSILVAIILGLCIWKSLNNIYYIPSLFKRFIWDPRHGEPIWTEAFRLLIQYALVFLFAVYLAFSVYQILKNSTTNITIITKVPSVQVPDIRFCFEGLATVKDPHDDYTTHNGTNIYCITDRGVSCGDSLIKLNTTMHLPVSEDYTTPSECFLFSPPKWFQLGDTTNAQTNGTKIQFLFDANPGLADVVRINQYPPGMNPNIKLYDIDTADLPLLMSDQDVNTWAIGDMHGKSTPSTIKLTVNHKLRIKYQIKDHQYLEETGWNKIGFLSRYNHTPELSFSTQMSKFGTVSNRIGTTDMHISGSITLSPVDYNSAVIQEQRIHTVINSLGSVGGIFSLLIAVQILLFGFRPKSPWGTVQNWSCWFMLESLQRPLQEKFKGLGPPVPFVSPVKSQSMDTEKSSYTQIDEDEILLLNNHQYEELKDLRSRLYQLEKRAQLTERLLQAYYIDTEIFKELDTAIGQNKRKSSAATLIEERNSSDSAIVQRRAFGKNNV